MTEERKEFIDKVARYIKLDKKEINRFNTRTEVDPEQGCLFIDELHDVVARMTVYKEILGVLDNIDVFLSEDTSPFDLLDTSANYAVGNALNALESDYARRFYRKALARNWFNIWVAPGSTIRKQFVDMWAMEIKNKWKEDEES